MYIDVWRQIISHVCLSAWLFNPSISPPRILLPRVPWSRPSATLTGNQTGCDTLIRPLHSLSEVTEMLWPCLVHQSSVVTWERKCSSWSIYSTPLQDFGTRTCFALTAFILGSCTIKKYIFSVKVLPYYTYICIHVLLLEYIHTTLNSFHFKTETIPVHTGIFTPHQQ